MRPRFPLPADTVEQFSGWKGEVVAADRSLDGEQLDRQALPMAAVTRVPDPMLAHW